MCEWAWGCQPPEPAREARRVPGRLAGSSPGREGLKGPWLLRVCHLRCHASLTFSSWQLFPPRHCPAGLPQPPRRDRWPLSPARVLSPAGWTLASGSVPSCCPGKPPVPPSMPASASCRAAARSSPESGADDAAPRTPPWSEAGPSPGRGDTRGRSPAANTETGSREHLMAREAREAAASQTK